ncbi:hypothetical protein INS49_015513 [Diaporthe citri]|uniref:uncharacterized protein n=1 Tax=Diaporthe citri TaxID=83186 RepID=UPI001C7EB9EE|nr:uncharacterized protein INS49_015513 [Diaporthe citri]KAG6356127.1 hypothetical protein INS49_015513 [Diaporthe citri]
MAPARSHLAPAALYAAALLLPAASANFGNSFYLGPWDGAAYITKATYSLAAPAVIQGYDTSDKSLWISIWVGVQPNVPDVSQANLVQPLLNWCADQASCGCDAGADEWCVTASTYTPEGQTGNAYVAVPKDAKLDFEIAVNADTKKIDQKVTLNGKVVSELSDSQGMKPQIIYSANECSTDGCGTLPDFSWDNVTITLSEAKKDLGTIISYHGASSSGLKTTDGGVTWHADSISMGKDTDWSIQ